MGTGRGKKQEETALRQNLLTTQQAIQPSEAETAANARTKQFNDQVAAGTDVKDITAINPYYQIYQGAVNQQNQDRMGTGILNLARGGNSLQAQNYLTQSRLRQQQDAAGQLAGAYEATNADLNNQGYQYAALANSRNLGKASAATSAYNTYMGNKGPSTFDKIMKIGQLAIGGIGAWRG